MSFDININCQLGERPIGLTLHTAAGLTALFGPSGVGKTSVLNMIAGLLRPDNGRIDVGGTVLFDSASGVNVPPQLRRAGYVFQQGLLFPHMRVRDNLAYGMQRAIDAEPVISFDDAIAFLGIGDLLDRWPDALSGGEAQRVAIGRALLSAPHFLLMDEPLTSLDLPRRQEIMQVIERLRDEIGLPILYVSHDRAEVERLATHIIPMEFPVQ